MVYAVVIAIGLFASGIGILLADRIWAKDQDWIGENGMKGQR